MVAVCAISFTAFFAAGSGLHVVGDRGSDSASMETAVRSTCIGDAFGTLFRNASTSAGIARFATSAAFSSSSSACLGSFPCHSKIDDFLERGVFGQRLDAEALIAEQPRVAIDKT